MTAEMIVAMTVETIVEAIGEIIEGGATKEVRGVIASAIEIVTALLAVALLFLLILIPLNLTLSVFTLQTPYPIVNYFLIVCIPSFCHLAI